MSETVTVTIAGTPTPIVLFDSNTLEAAGYAASAAASAAAAEAFAGPTYASQAAGEAATTTGEYFAVNASGIVSIYVRTGGGSTLERVMLTTTALAATTGGALVGLAAFSGTTIPDGSNAQTGLQALETAHESVASDIATHENNIAAVINLKDKGAVGDGVADDTNAVLDFFTECIATGKSGHIPAGTYRVDVGTLLFDNLNVATPWPFITTAGEDAVTFMGVGTGNFPIIEFRNGEYDGGAGADRYWFGGSLGGITFKLESAVAGTNRHGIKMYGVWGTKFGNFTGDTLGGSTLHFTDKKYLVTNPDPYAVTYCEFGLTIGIRNTVRTIDNRNFVGLNFCTFNGIRGVENVGGILFGFGASNTFNRVAGGGCSGYAINQGDIAEGVLDRSTVNGLEIDDCEYGLNLPRADSVEIKNMRFVHRFSSSPLNLTSLYWPLVCMSVAGGVGAVVTNSTIKTRHRIDPGGTKPDVGVFLDLNNAGGNIVNLTVDQTVTSAGAGFTMDDADLVANYNVNSQVLLKRDGKIIGNTIPNNSFKATASGTLAIGNAGYGTATAILGFNSETRDSGDVYDPALFCFTAPYTGDAWFRLKFPLNIAAGQNVRLSLFDGTNNLDEVQIYSSVAAVETYQLAIGNLRVTKGQTIYAAAVQSTGGSVNATALSGGNSTSIIFEGGMVE